MSSSVCRRLLDAGRRAVKHGVYDREHRPGSFKLPGELVSSIVEAIKL